MLYSQLSCFLMCVCFATTPIKGVLPDSTQEYAAAFWKNNVRKQTSNLQSTQTEQVLAYGSGDIKQMEMICKAAERAVVYARKSVGYDVKPTERPNQQMSDRPHQWEGKLIIFICRERHEFNDLFIKLKKARPDVHEVSVYLHDKSRSYILLGPASQGQKVNYEVLAVELAGSATLTRRHDPLPHWFTLAYGRLLAYKFDAKGFQAERSRIPYWAAKAHVRDLMVDDNPSLEAGTLLPLQTSLVEYLSHSSQFKEDWFKILDETAFRSGNLAAALEELKYPLETVQIEWKNSLWKASGGREK